MGSRKRSELKNYFIKGRIPKEEDFQDLIDSTINLSDDRIDIDEENGLLLEKKDNNTVLTIRKNIDNEDSFWRIELDEEDNDSFIQFKYNQNDIPILSLSKTGNVGIGIEKPIHKLDFDGLIGYHGRLGYYRFGEVNADGQWHNIIEGISSPIGVELIANCGEKGAHAITHAIAVCTYGNSKGGIQSTQNYFGRSRNKIEVRWAGDYFNYSLQIKTGRAYSRETKIKYHVALLWE